MATKGILHLTNYVPYALKLGVFDSRYGSGFVAMLGDEFSHIAAVEENFDGGDDDMASVRFPLDKMEWFPLAFGESPCEAIDALEKKLDAFVVKTFQGSWEWSWPLSRWLQCIELVGKRIEENAHRKLLLSLSEMPYDDTVLDIIIRHR